MKSVMAHGMLLVAILCWFSPLRAACFCGPGVPCDLYLSDRVLDDTDFIACERVFLQSGFSVDPKVDVRIAAGLEISFEGDTGVDQSGVLSTSVFPDLACEGDADQDLYNTCLDCDDDRSDVNPGAQEVCDLLDNDCDGQVDGPDACPCGVDPVAVYDGQCPAECTGGCLVDQKNGYTCEILCDSNDECRYGNISCPPGMHCNVRCLGDNSCADALIACADNFSCHVGCAVNGCARSQVLCALDGSCDLSCEGAGCRDLEMNCSNDECTATCQFPEVLPTVNCGTSCNCDVSSCR